MKPERLTTDCPKHGRTHALLVINGVVQPGTADLRWWEKLFAPRVCMKCLAEAMVQPIRRRAA